MENYVLKYYVFTDFSNIYYIDVQTEESSGIKFEAVFYNGELVNPIFPENEDMYAKFREIAEYNGDTAYYRPVSTCFPYACLPHEAGRFDICCDAEYGGYPAGTSLNEFVTVYFYSAEEFVKSAYAAEYANAPLKQYSKPLTEFNAGKHALVASSGISFVLNIKPDYPAEYRFTFTYSGSSGEFVSNVYRDVK
jgi:hypothetical protein